MHHSRNDSSSFQTLMTSIPLSERKLEVEKRMVGGWGPLHVCAVTKENSDVIPLLLSHGADPAALTKNGFSALHLAACVVKNPFICSFLPFLPFSSLLFLQTFHFLKVFSDWFVYATRRQTMTSFLHVAIDTMNIEIDMIWDWHDLRLPRSSPLKAPPPDPRPSMFWTSRPQ